MTVEELNVIITAQNSEFKRRIDEVNGRLNKMSQTAQNSSDKTYSVFKGLAGKVAALGIGKIIANSITEGMNAIESESLFEVSLGSYADSAREWSEKLGDALGLDEYTLRKNIGTLFTMTQSMGIAKDSALSMSQNITQLAEDMASFYNITSDEAFNKLRSGLTGETEPLKQLGILVDETTIKQYAYKNGIAAVGDELTQTQKVMARYAAIMEQTSTAQGDLARTMDSPANQLRALKNDIKELMIDTGTSLMPTVSSLLSMARSGLEVVTPLITGAAEGVNEVAQAILDASPRTQTLLTLTLASAVAIPAVTKAQMLLTLAQRGYSALLSILIPKQITFAAALQATAGWIGIIAGALAIFSLIGDANANAQKTTKDAVNDLTAEKKAAEDAASGVDALADSMNGLGEAVTGGLAAVDKLNVAGSTSGGKFVTDKDISNISDAVSLTTELENIFEKLTSDELAFDPFGDMSLDSLYESVKKGWNWLVNDGWALLQDGVQNLFSTGQDIWSVIFGDDSERYNALSRMTKGIEQVFGSDWTNFWTDIGKNVNKALTGGTEQERYEGWKAIDDEFKKFFGQAGEDWSGFWQQIGGGIEDFARGDLQSGLEAINSQFEGLFGELGKAHSDFWQKFGAGAYSVLNAGQIQDNQLHDKYSTLMMDMQSEINDLIRSGLSAEDALAAAEMKYITSAEKAYYYENLDTQRRSLEQLEAVEDSLQMQDYRYGTADSYYAQIADTTASDYYRQQGLAAEQRKEEQRKTTTLNIQVNSYLDGEKVGESMATREISETEASNDY